eukprot:1161505-Pelagomonas_calceolata.AAC.7
MEQQSKSLGRASHLATVGHQLLDMECGCSSPTCSLIIDQVGDLRHGSISSNDRRLDIVGR